MDNLVQRRSSPDAEIEMPSEDVQRRVIEICSRFLNSGAINPDDSLADLGASSLALICIVAKVQDDFGVDFDPMTTAEILFSSPTPRLLASYLRPKV